MALMPTNAASHPAIMPPATSLAERVTAALAARIVTGDLAPGSRLPEVELAGSLGVSRNTVREAMKALAERGLVQLGHNRGAVVVSLSVNGVRDLYRVRRLFELSAIDTARTMPPESLHEVGAAMAALAQAVDRADPVPIIEADLGFHRALVRLHGSERIDRAFAVSLDELRLGLGLVDRHNTPLAGLLDEHRHLYSLLIRGDFAGCRAALARHLDESEGRLHDALRP